jgi:hypothetical protein
LCRGAQSANGRQTHHAQAGLSAYCEQGLKSIGERIRTGGAVTGAFGLREAVRAREVALRGGVKGLCLISQGIIPCWRIVDRKYRLALRVAATKSASRSLRTYSSI